MHVPARLVLLVMLAAAGGCDASDVPPSEGGADTSAVSLGTGDTPYRAAADDGLRPQLIADFGRGILHLTARGDTSAGTHEDTVLIRRAPTDDAAIVARWIHRYATEGTWEYRLETGEQNLIRADIEWLYEENGLPMDTIAGDSSWLRVVYATDEGGDARFGWVRLTDPMAIEMWPDVLMEQNLHFRRPDSLAFFATPNGELEAIEIQSGDTSDGLDYTMVPLGVVGEWMQVEVTSPSDYCAEAPGASKDTAWIRYLDARARPRVWYFTRGC